MAWYNSLLRWNGYQQNTIQETLNPTLLPAPQLEPYTDHSRPVPYLTSADESAIPVGGNGTRFYGALPSQGDWYSPPPNPAAWQSWH